MTLPVAKREIHNGHDLWAELLGILLSGPNLGMCSRNADWAAYSTICARREGRRKGWGAAWQAPVSVEEVQVAPVGERLHRLPVGTRYRLEVECLLNTLCKEEWKEEWLWSLACPGFKFC